MVRIVVAGFVVPARYPRRVTMCRGNVQGHVHPIVLANNVVMMAAVEAVANAPQTRPVCWGYVYRLGVVRPTVSGRNVARTAAEDSVVNALLG